MPTSRIAAIVYRFFFAGLSLAALFAQLFLVTLAQGHSVVNFFGYFTILSNLFVSIVMIVSAVRLFQGTAASAFDVGVRGAGVVYIAFVGIVFSTLLRDVDLGSLIPWVNAVHHYIIPIVVVLDWIIWPPQRKIGWRAVLLWMIFPIVYVIVSLIRGAATGFYPYPFFDPAVQGGYGGVALYCAIMVVVFVILAVLVRLVGNLRARQLR